MTVPAPAPRTGHVLQVGPLHPLVEEALDTEFSALRLPDDDAAAGQFLDRHADRVRVAVGSGRTGVGTELMRRLPRLEAVVHFGVGYDGTDAAEAAARGIALSNTPDVLTDAVADTALALYLDVLRRFSAADRWVRRGDWEARGNYPLTVHASGRRVGILGLGRIGRAVAHRLEALGCEIHYHNRRPVPGTEHTYHGSVLELAAAVEVLVVAVPGGPDSAGTVDAAVLAALGPEGFLVNVARGSVVDETALVEALTQGRLGGAGLDVFAAEPHVPEALRELDSVVLLPHVGSATVQTRREMAELTLRNLRSWLTSGTLVTPVG
ncbi:2-hydroxyacid dehydrogenase [Kocuria sp. M1R5S2]|uniref:2-hydroxyacid dehydrogenase n=1 Tax=Kocuria rhizosphaerae TaxID=3376285 RepID=UPI0037A29C29